MSTINKQEFDFTSESNAQESENWIQGLKSIPLPPKNYWVKGSEAKEELGPETEMSATYEFIDMGDDTWFWISILFRQNFTASVDCNFNYSIGDEDELLPVVNQWLSANGLEELTDLNVLPEKEFNNWQEGYDFLCEIARKKKVPEFKKQ